MRITVSRQIITCTDQGKAWTGERRGSAENVASCSWRTGGRTARSETREGKDGERESSTTSPDGKLVHRPRHQQACRRLHLFARCRSQDVDVLLHRRSQADCRECRFTPWAIIRSNFV